MNSESRKATPKQQEFLQEITDHLNFYKDGNDLNSPSHWSENSIKAQLLQEKYFPEATSDALRTEGEICELLDNILTIVRKVK